MPPDLKTLENRLKSRGTETPERLATRLGKAKKELLTADQFDYVILNDDLEKAIGAARIVVNKFLES
jgi:guanylate kinase